MDFFKQNKGFSIALGVLLVLFLAHLGLAASSIRQAAKAERRARSQAQNLDSLLRLSPAPSEANLAAARADLQAYRIALMETLSVFERTTELAVSSDAIEVLPRIQGLIVDFRREARRAGIEIEPDEAFSFARYEESIEPPPPDSIPLLDKQIQLVEYLLGRLLAAAPKYLVGVERELVEAGDPNRLEANTVIPSVDGTFRLSPAVSARINETLDTLAFRLTFEGYTESLRIFLNSLGQFEFPFVVRSVEVTPARERGRSNGSGEGANGSEGQGGSPFAGLFLGALPDTRPADAEAVQDGVTQQPIIEDNLSRFAVTVEFIEVVVDFDTLEQQFEAEFTE